MFERYEIVIASAVDSMQKEPDLEIGLIGQRKVVRADGRFGYVGEANNKSNAMDLIEDIEEEVGVLLWIGKAINIDRTLKQGRVVEKKDKIGLWQRREP